MLFSLSKGQVPTPGAKLDSCIYLALARGDQIEMVLNYFTPESESDYSVQGKIRAVSVSPHYSSIYLALGIPPYEVRGMYYQH